MTSHLFFDDYIYIYRIRHPDPISFKGGVFMPVMDAEAYKTRLESKLVQDLHKVAMGGWNINWKWILLIAVALIVIYYFISGGTIFPTGQEETVSNSVVNVVNSSRASP